MAFYINSQNMASFGVSLSEGGLAELMTPPAMKERVTNRSRLQHGTRYDTAHDKVDERTINLPVHIIAENSADFLSKYNAFVALLTSSATLVITDDRIPSTRYKCLYQSCTQYAHFFGGIAKFTLKLVEPNPTDRS